MRQVFTSIGVRICGHSYDLLIATLDETGETNDLESKHFVFGPTGLQHR